MSKQQFKYVRIQGKELARNTMYAKGIFSMCMQMIRDEIMDAEDAELYLYLAEKGFSAVKEAQGLALDSVSETTDVLERDTVIFPKFDREKCVGCHLCVLVCPERAIRSARKRITRTNAGHS